MADDTKKPEAGDWYWLIMKSPDFDNQWLVGQWLEEWWIVGCRETFAPDAVLKIGPRIEVPSDG